MCGTEPWLAPALGDYSRSTTAPDPTTWAGPEPPRVQRKWYTPRPQQWVRTPMGECRTPRIQSGPPRLVQDLHVCKPDPWNGIRTPLRMGSGPPTMGSQGPRTEHTQALNRTQAGVRCRHVSGPSLVGSGPVCIHSYPRSGGDPLQPHGILRAT
jgi:hypothetical protein